MLQLQPVQPPERPHQQALLQVRKPALVPERLQVQPQALYPSQSAALPTNAGTRL